MSIYHYIQCRNRPIPRSGHMVRNKLPTCWDASYTVALPKQRNSYQSSPTFLVLKVPLCNLCPSIIYFLPCDRIVQRVYYSEKQHSNSPQLFFRAVRAKIVQSRWFLSSDTEYLRQKYNDQMTVNKRQITWWGHRFTFYLSNKLSLARLHYASICESLTYWSAESKSLTGTQSVRESRTKGVKFTPQRLLGKYK